MYIEIDENMRWTRALILYQNTAFLLEQFGEEELFMKFFWIQYY